MTEQTREQVERENPKEIKLKWTREDCKIKLDGRYCPIRGIILDEPSRRGLLYHMHLYGGGSSDLIGYAVFGGTSRIFGGPYHFIEPFHSEILKSGNERRDVSVEESDITVPRETFENLFELPDESVARSLIDTCYEIKNFQDFMWFKKTFPRDAF